MTEEQRSGTEMARILTLLDASRPSQDALRAAVELAVRRHAELMALHVEDIDLLRSAAYPFACELGSATGRRRAMTADSVEAALQRQSERVNQLLQRAVHGRRIRHRLHVTRGSVVSEVLTMVAPEDLLVLGKTGASSALGPGMGSTCRALIQRAPCPVLVWEQSRNLRAGAVLLASEEAEPDTRHQAWRQQALIDWLRETGVATSVKRVSRMEPSQVLGLAAEQRGGVLVVTRAFLETFSPEEIQRLDKLTVPVLVTP